MKKWAWKNFGFDDVGGVISPAVNMAMAGGKIVPGWGHAIGGVVGAGIGIAKAGIGGQMKITPSYQVMGDNINRGRLRDPFGGGASWLNKMRREKLPPDTGIWDSIEQGLYLSSSIYSGLKL